MEPKQQRNGRKEEAALTDLRIPRTSFDGHALIVPVTSLSNPAWE